jgi:hypothetical protein
MSEVSLHNPRCFLRIVACLLRAETVIGGQQLRKYISTANRSRDHGRAYTQHRNMSRHVMSASAVMPRDNTGILGSGVFCWVQAKAMSGESSSQSTEIL